jgi:WD40 repeat protein
MLRRACLLLLFVCNALTPVVAEPEGAGERRGPLLIRERTIEVDARGGTARIVGPVGGKIEKALLSGDGARLAILWLEKTPRNGMFARIDVWDVRANTLQGRLEGQSEGGLWAQGMAWRPQNDVLAWCDWDREDIEDTDDETGIIRRITKRTGFVYLWDGRSATPRKITVPDRKMFSVAFTRDGRRVVAACGDVRVRVWNFATGKLERTVATEQTAAQYAANLSKMPNRRAKRRKRR